MFDLFPEYASGILLNRLFQKNSKQWAWCWVHGISTGIEETACGNSSRQLKKKWNFPGWSRYHDEFPWVLVFGLGIFKGCHTIFQNFQVWIFVFSRISNGKVINLKVPGFFSKHYVLNPPCLGFSGIAQ